MRRVLRSAGPLAALAALSLLAAGCGGSSAPSVASVASSSSTTTTPGSGDSRLLAFSRCMRSSGVPGFPDPQRFAGGNVKLTIHDTPSTPKARAALAACSHLLPAGRAQSDETTRTQIADELSFARCMRSHGVTGFPDPTAQGGLSVEMVEAAGVDVHSAAVLRVVQTCLPASHGALTAAKVREALANAGH
jgi:hypothetical protein